MKFWWALAVFALADEPVTDDAESRVVPDRGINSADRLLSLASKVIGGPGGGKGRGKGGKGGKGKKVRPSKAPKKSGGGKKRGGKYKKNKPSTTSQTTTTTSTTTTTKQTTTTRKTTTKKPTTKKPTPPRNTGGSNQSNNAQAAYNYVGTAGQTQDLVDANTPPQFFLPGSLTPADVTKWGSGCSLHCLHGFSGRCQLCGSAACRVAPHEFECRQYKHCTLNVNGICKPGEDCDAVRTKWWQLCWTSPCTSRCWYKGSIGNHDACEECCDLACRDDERYVGNSCFRCTLCASKWGPHTWGKLSPEAKYNGHVCWGRDKTKGSIMTQLKYDLPKDSNMVITGTINQSGSLSNSRPNQNYKPNSNSNVGDVGISQTANLGSFETTKTSPKKLKQDKSKDCLKICHDARKSTTRGEPAHVQAREWNQCKECFCWENPQMEMCEAIDCHVACLSSNMSGESCLSCTRCKTCPEVANKDKNDNFVNAVQSIFSRDQAGSVLEENDKPLLLGERSGHEEDITRTVNSQFGYIHSASREATVAIKDIGVLNVFMPKCMMCNRMDQRQSCRESCAAYKRNPQNHIAAHNCKQGNCAVILASACKKCIRNCDNIKAVTLAAAGNPKPTMSETSFENCYYTFGCANDCSAALKKVQGDLDERRSLVPMSISDMSLENQIEWAMELPYESKKDAKAKGLFINGVLVDEELQSRRKETTDWSYKEIKRNGWWWRL